MDLSNFDTYTIKARIFPTFIVVSPLVLLIISIFPDQTSLFKTILGLVSGLGLTALLAQLGRDEGKKKEPWLFQLWGGIPTNKILSHSLSHLEQSTLRRYHAKLNSLVSGINLPNPELERLNPDQADQVYSSCTRYLREQTRDKKRFPLVFSENVNYGFRRNLWAMKETGVFFSVLGILGCAIVFTHSLMAKEGISAFAVIATLICCFLLSFWIFRVKPEWIKMAADAYAERLVASLDSM